LGWVSQNQIKRAREVAAIDYILKHEKDKVKQVGKEYRFLDHNSLSVSNKGWYWHSNGIGGWSALSYLTEARGYGLVDAVCILLNEFPQNSSDPITIENHIVIQTKKAEKSTFELPLRNQNNNRVKAYLQSRGIDTDIIMECINRGDLYESRLYHNCVFIGKDETGKARYAGMRSTTTNFMCDSKGSDKRYGFILPPDNPDSNEIAVFEAAIDALSHYSLSKNGYIPQFDAWRLALGGSNILALEHFLKQHPQVNHCVICVDDDTAGEMISARIKTIPGITTERSLPTPDNKDWNDVLIERQKTERNKNTSWSNNEPCL